ncbi:MAG: sensor histidine kinase [Proteobacteria bacterium]|nr:sensor histidine kinase [Pseudomonadota bacterium]
MDLKWLLVRRVTLVALACLLAGSGFTLWRTNLDAKRANEELTESVGRQLELQLALRSPRFPDWDLVTSYALRPGQCVDFLFDKSPFQHSSCAGVDTASIEAPSWFLGAFRAFLDGSASVTRKVSYRNKYQGLLRASFDPVATAGEAWTTIAPLIGLSAVLLGALCVVAYFVIDRALRPTKEILSALSRLTAGDLSSRLPAFRLPEFNKISGGINSLSDELGKANAERSELARRLVDAQEYERRHIARELHDEIAQKLAALSALAACVRASAKSGDHSLASEARDLEMMSADLMVTLRKTLTYLRPQTIDDLGLVASLEGLVSEHNERGRGHTRYSLSTTGDIEHLRPETSAHVYRIVQEALNNAAKHARARSVQVVLDRVHGSGGEKIALSIVDDGSGPAKNARPLPNSGAGIIGMRERVLALSGSFMAGPQPHGGFELRVEFPSFQEAS